MSFLFYRRPRYVQDTSGPINRENCQRHLKQTLAACRKIPDELSLDNIIESRTSSPCSLADFLDYLRFAGKGAETLQFYLWLREYTRRFNELEFEERTLSPEWTHTEETLIIDPLRHSRKIVTIEITVESVTGVLESSQQQAIIAPLRVESEEAPGNRASYLSEKKTIVQCELKTQDDADQPTIAPTSPTRPHWDSYAIQPFRDEITNVVIQYFTYSATRKLNISHRDLTATLYALQHTTHPSAFAAVNDLIEATLRGQSHPSFVRWSLCNSNRPRIFFVRLIGTALVVSGIVLGIILTLSSLSRWWCLLCGPLLVFGLVGLIASSRGICPILHIARNCRALRPWEAAAASTRIASVTTTIGRDCGDQRGIERVNDPTLASNLSLQVDMEKQVRSLSTAEEGQQLYEADNRIRKYNKKPLLRRIFGDVRFVEEEVVRKIQRHIMLQSVMWALLATSILTSMFVALPRGNYI